MDENIIKRNIEYNKVFDNRLYTTHKITKDDIIAFDESVAYGAASTIGWVRHKLKILKEVLDEGYSIQIEGFGEITEHSAFKEWIKNRYEEFMVREVYEK